MKSSTDLEAEALRRVHEARQGKKISLTGPQAIALQDFYRKLIDTANLRGLCLEGNHP